MRRAAAWRRAAQVLSLELAALEARASHDVRARLEAMEDSLLVLGATAPLRTHGAALDRAARAQWARDRAGRGTLVDEAAWEEGERWVQGLASSADARAFGTARAALRGDVSDVPPEQEWAGRVPVAASGNAPRLTPPAASQPSAAAWLPPPSRSSSPQYIAAHAAHEQSISQSARTHTESARLLQLARERAHAAEQQHAHAAQFERARAQHAALDAVIASAAAAAACGGAGPAASTGLSLIHI